MEKYFKDNQIEHSEKLSDKTDDFNYCLNTCQDSGDRDSARLHLRC